MFITFEGMDGCGKTAQAEKLFNFFKSKNKIVILTKEPGGGGDFSLKIRQLLSETEELDLLTEMLAILSARNEHVKNIIEPNLSMGNIVICDRFIDSTISYFCYNKSKVEKEKAIKLIYEINTYICKKIVPDITFFIDASYNDSILRIKKKHITDRYDLFDENKYNLIVNIFNELYKEDSKRIKKINGNASIEDVFQEILSYINI